MTPQGGKGCIMPFEIQGYYDDVVKAKLQLTDEKKFHENGEYVTLYKLQQKCLEKGYSVETFLKQIEVFILGECYRDVEISYEDITSAVMAIKTEVKMSMRELTRRLGMERGNVYKLLKYRAKTQKSCALTFIIKLAHALGVMPSYIFEKARMIQEEREGKKMELSE